MCSIRTTLWINTAIFAIIGILHIARLILGWPANIAGLTISLWASVVFVVLAGILIFLNAKHLRNKKLK